MRSAAIQKQTWLNTKQNYARPSKSWDHVPMRISAGLHMEGLSSCDCRLAMPARAVNATDFGRTDAVPMEFDASLDMRKSSGKTQQFCLGLKLLALRGHLSTQN